MYEEGFKWWNLGSASAVAFLLFLLIFAVTLAPGAAGPEGGGVSRRGQAVAVNAGLVVVAALTLFPLAWMLSVSFMATGEASNFPPPLLPDGPEPRPATASSSRTPGMARYFAQQRAGRRRR